MKKSVKYVSLILALILAMALFAGCGSKDDETASNNGGSPNNAASDNESKGDKADTAEPTATPTPLPPLELSIMIPGGGTNENDNEEWQIKFYEMIESYTNTKLQWIHYNTDMYYEKLTLALASGDLPHILISGKNAEFLNAVKNDAFWDITDYIGDYENLSTMSETVFLNASINGRLYGVPRGRALGRNGFGYRLDWVNNLGLKEPETIDELYDMLVGFTYDDPDGNGKDDTYGLGVTSYTGTWDIMQLWFGAPNGWGIDENGDLIPAHLTQEYKNALAWFRKIYSEGLVNPDFNTIAGGDWDTLLLRSGVAGATADVLDRFRRNQGYFESEGIPAEHMMVGAIDAGYGLRTLPTAGYADLIVFSKQKITNEDDLKRAIQFIDDLGDAEMENLLSYGIEGYSYYLDENGYLVTYTAEEKAQLGLPTYGVNKGFNQILPYFNTPEEKAKIITREPADTFITNLEAELLVENEKYVVPNYGAPYVSETYTQLATTLDEIINNARISYIMGEIDDVGLQEALNQWLRAGGETVIEEMNELYHAAGN
ncbi:MAG: extracellular solute-binding protein [Clostridiales bacterium]|nr:extracellular solute-binding protein [Clostridiales bacterium]